VVHNNRRSALAPVARLLVNHAEVAFGVGGENLFCLEDGMVEAGALADPHEFPGKVNPENVEASSHESERACGARLETTATRGVRCFHFGVSFVEAVVVLPRWSRATRMARRKYETWPAPDAVLKLERLLEDLGRH